MKEYYIVLTRTAVIRAEDKEDAIESAIQELYEVNLDMAFDVKIDDGEEVEDD